MNRYYKYHIINHFTPPTLEADNEIQETLLKLESITACLIMKNKNICYILSQTPSGLHTVIWKAYLREKYYSYRKSLNLNSYSFSSIDFSDLSELLHHWPNEEFTLKKVMPSLPSRLCWFSYLDEGKEYDNDWGCGPPLQTSQTYLHRFYAKVSNTILEFFLKSKTKDFVGTHRDGCKIRKLDISGFVFIWESIEQPFDRNFILEYIKSGDNLIETTANNIEVICDAKIMLKNDKIFDIGGKSYYSYNGEEFESDIEDIEDIDNEDAENMVEQDTEDSDEDEDAEDNDSDEEDVSNEDAEDIDNENFENVSIEYKGNVIDKYTMDLDNRYKSLALTFSYAFSDNSIFSYSHLSFQGYNCTEKAAHVIRKFINERTESVVFLEGIPKYATFMKDVFESTFHQINNISVSFEYGSCIAFSFNFLQYFKNLDHLDLSDNNLHGKLDPLMYLEKGLHYLRLVRCRLDNSDLGVLLRGLLKYSLLELSLSGNMFDENSTNLIKLCQELPNVIVLGLGNCSLEKISDNELSLLCKSFISLPNLVYLDLETNLFSMDIIKSHLVSLSDSPSLKLLILDKADTKQQSALITTMMNQNRPELLYVQPYGYF